MAMKGTVLSSTYKGIISKNNISNIKNPQNGDYYIIAETGNLIFFSNGKFLEADAKVMDTGEWPYEEEDYSRDYFN